MSEAAPDELDPIHTLERIARAFEEHRIPYMVVGGWAAIAYGSRRTTFDIDLVVDVPVEAEPSVKTVIESLGLIVEGPIETSPENIIGRRLRVRELATPVEVFLAAKSPLVGHEFARMGSIQIGGRRFPAISREDLIMRKLVLIEKVSNRKNREMDLLDLRAVMGSNWLDLDFDYLREQARLHRVTGQLEGYLDEVRNERAARGLPV